VQADKEREVEIKNDYEKIVKSHTSPNPTESVAQQSFWTTLVQNNAI